MDEDCFSIVEDQQIEGNKDICVGQTVRVKYGNKRYSARMEAIGIKVFL